MEAITDRLKSWAIDLDDNAMAQALRTSRSAVVVGHVALMPDAHLGYGATVGSVVPTEGAIIPSCVGVDIGCGMIAARTDLVAAELPDSLDSLLDRIGRAIPAGVGKGHDAVARNREHRAEKWLDSNRSGTDLDGRQRTRAFAQLGTLGSGNHFLEVCLDEQDRVWVVLHSGSRGIGNQLAQGHIKTAGKVAKRLEIGLEDPDLAYLLEGTPEFDHYLADLLWAQAYAAENREIMMDAALASLFTETGKGREQDRINAHHNYTERELHDGRELWITRKGAIRAASGDRGIIPGSMATGTYIVRGLGNADSFNSCSHGAGRRLSRGRARRELGVESLATAMAGKTWLAARANELLDEHPDAYKDVAEVMAAQSDLVEVEHILNQVLNYKGV